MDFLTITKYFIFLTLDLLICEFLLRIVLHGVSNMGWVIFVECDWMGFVDYSFKMLHFSVIMIEFQYWVCLLIGIYLSMSYPLWSVLMPYFYFFGDFLVIHFDCVYGWVTMFVYYMIRLCVWLCTLGDSCWVSVLTVIVLCFKIGVKMHCVLLIWVISWHVDLELCMNKMFGIMLCLSLCH